MLLNIQCTSLIIGLVKFIYENTPENISLSKLCTFGIGGDARYLINIKTKEDLKEALALANEKQLPIFVLGGGSNIVLPDEGINGVVLRMMNNNISATNNEIEIESGANWTKIMSFL